MARRGTPVTTGVTDRALIAQLVVSDFVGSVELLAMKTRSQARYVWISIVRLAETGLITAHKAGDGQLNLNITRMGRAKHYQLTGRHPQASRYEGKYQEGRRRVS